MRPVLGQPLDSFYSRRSGVKKRVRADTAQQCTLSATGSYTDYTACMSAAAADTATFKWTFDASAGACVRAYSGAYDTQDACIDSQLKWSCDGNGGCVQSASGTYRTKSDCRCVGCINNACSPVPANSTGTFASITTCLLDSSAKCGWKFGCESPQNGGDSQAMCKAYPVGDPLGVYNSKNDCMCVMAYGPPGESCQCVFKSSSLYKVFNSVDACKADPTAMCGWPNSMVPALTPAGLYKGTPTTVNGSTVQTTTLTYVPVDKPFVATSSKVRVLSPYLTGDTFATKLEILYDSGWSRYGVQADIVLVPYGNVTANTMDPPQAGAQYCMKSNNVMSCVPEQTTPISVGGAISWQSQVGTYYNTTPNVGTPLDTVVDVVPGKQYRLYVRGGNTSYYYATLYFNKVSVTPIS